MVNTNPFQRRFTVWLDIGLTRQVREAAAKQQETIVAFVNRALTAELARMKAEQDVTP